MTRIVRLTMPVAATLMLLCGCGSFPLPRVYILGDPTMPVASVSSEAGRPVFALDTVTVPDYLDSTDIVHKAGSNEVRVSSNGKWGERLSVGLTRALVSALSRRLPNIVIERRTDDEAPWRILVDIQHFDIGTNGECTLSARWHIITADGMTASVGEDGTFTEPGGGSTDAAAVAAMTLATDKLADRIAQSVQRIKLKSTGQ